MKEPILFILKSLDRDTTSASSSNFKQTFSGSVWLSQVWQNVVEVSLEGAVIPNTLYNIRSGVNNVIKFTNSNSGGGTKTGTVTAGSYTIDTLVTALGTAMTTGDGTDTFTVTYSATTNKVSITTVAGTGTITVLFTSSTINSTIGFSSTANSSAATTVTGVNVFNLAQPYNLFINIPELELFHVQSSNQLDKPTFTIPVTSPEGDVISYFATQFLDQQLRFGNPRSFRELNVRLTLDGNEAADLNGSEWTLYLLLKTL
jgi:hypothetical protein